MRKQVIRLLRDERGTTFEGVALGVSVVAVCFVASADIANYVGKKHPSTSAATVQLASAPFNPGLDYTPTGSVGSLHSEHITLDPCTGARK